MLNGLQFAYYQGYSNISFHSQIFLINYTVLMPIEIIIVWIVLYINKNIFIQFLRCIQNYLTNSCIFLPSSKSNDLMSLDYSRIISPFMPKEHNIAAIHSIYIKLLKTIPCPFSKSSYFGWKTARNFTVTISIL